MEMKTESEELSDGVWIEEIDNAALKQFEKHQKLQRIYNIMAWPSCIDYFPYSGQLGQSPYSQGFPYFS